MTFEQRKDGFQKKLLETMSEFHIDIYAVNVVMKNGEVMPIIKMLDTAKEEELKEETNEDKSKTESTTDSKA